MTGSSPGLPIQRLAAREFEAVPDLDERLLPALEAQPCFRRASEDEIDASYRAYRSGDISALERAWRDHAEPTRASLSPAMRAAYAQSRWAPKMANAVIFLVTVRAVLRAGERFREGLREDVREVIRAEFPWLEHRHQHIPDGPTPEFEFPAAFTEFVEHGELDDSRARWQLAVALNEIQQCCYSEYAAGLFRLPELRRHAARERALAHNYFGHWSPRCTRDLWRETIYVLDALNAAVFELVVAGGGRVLLRYGVGGMFSQRDQWRRFVAGLDEEQWLLPVAER